jgi:uncharacterized membrane protein YbhN (UPF0104 family)
LLLGIAYHQLYNKNDFEQWWKIFQYNLHQANVCWLIVSVALMPFNWLLEALKWRLLLKLKVNISVWTAFRAVISGITFGLMTPARVGEYGGRVLFVEEKYRWRAVVATMVSGYSQLLTVVSVGILGMTWFIARFLHWDVLLQGSILALQLTTIVAAVIGYFNIELIRRIVRRIPMLYRQKPLLDGLRILKRYSPQDLSVALGLAFLRYFIFSAQYYFILRFFQLPIGFFQGMAGVATIFLIQTSIPLPPALGLVTRGGVALSVWSFFSANQIAILAAALTIWVINLLFPALLGLIAVFSVNIFKEK